MVPRQLPKMLIRRVGRGVAGPSVSHLRSSGRRRGSALGTTTIGMLVQAALWGCMHALIPCPHSWPMLLPVARSTGRPRRTALLFGIGLTLTAAVLTLTLSQLGSLAVGSSWQRAEEVSGVVLILFGVAFCWKPGLVHIAHDHSSCAAPSCDRETRRTRVLIRRFGPGAGLVLLGALNTLIPCWTTGPVIVSALSSRHWLIGLGVGISFGAAASASLIVTLAIAHRGIKRLEGLTSGRWESLILRASGLLLVLLGLSLLFHLGHDHDPHDLHGHGGSEHR